jgi:hypothetical protein
MMDKRRLKIATTTAAILLMTSALPGAAAEFDPDAERVLRSMSTYLAGAKAFAVSSETALEVVTHEGEKLQLMTPVTATVRRPDRLVITRDGDATDQRFYYDGETLTLQNPKENVYATIPAPATIDGALEFARNELDIFAPAGDLIGTDAYAALTEDAVESRHLGMTNVGGHRCHHLAFRGREVDFQVWVEDGDRPLPWRFVITSKLIAGAPQFTMQMTSWGMKPKVTDASFEFSPPKDATSVPFVRVDY